MAEDARYRKCDLEDILSFHILCECDALVDIRHWVLGQAHPDAVNLREVELGFAVLLPNYRLSIEFNFSHADLFSYCAR